MTEVPRRSPNRRAAAYSSCEGAQTACWRAGRRGRASALPLLLLAACGGGGSGGAAPNAAAAASPAAATSVAGPCAVRASAADPGPVTDPNGPFFHDVVVAETADGVRLTGARRILEHASVPDGVRARDGSILVYYVNGALGSVWVARLTGAGATALGAIRLDGVESPEGIVDPDAFPLPDGRIRLTYLSGFGPPSSGNPRAMCQADSDDGLSFGVVGLALALSDQGSTDPSLARLGDGTWLLAHSRGQQTVLSRSSDGRTFTTEATLDIGGVPEITALPDGRLRLYVCRAGIEAYVSADGGRAWTREATVVTGTAQARIACDPSLVLGTRTFLYKTAP